MNCVHHNSVPAVGFCDTCGAALCPECYNYFDAHICYECAANAYLHDKKLLTKSLVAFFFAGIVGLVIGIFVGLEIPGYVAFGVIWGFLAGSSYGMALFANRGQRYAWYMYLLMLLFSIVLAPIYFIIRLVGLIKLGKIVKNERMAIEGHPVSRK